MLQTEIVKRQLSAHYDIDAVDIRETAGGTVGYTYAVDEKYFLKIYDTDLVITQRCTEKLFEQLNIVDALQNQSKLRNRICYPIKTSCGERFYIDEKYIGVLYNLIDGTALGYGEKYTPDELEQISALVKDLHAIDIAQFAECCPRETFDLSFADQLVELLDQETNRLPPEFSKMTRQYAKTITAKKDEAKSLAKKNLSFSLPFVLCHTDIHGGNIMKDEDGKLYLVDWENVVLAPKEADLFAFSDDYSLSQFAENISEDALTYYIIHRDLEDIWEFLNSIIHDELNENELADVYCILKRIFAHLSNTK